MGNIGQNASLQRDLELIEEGLRLLRLDSVRDWDYPGAERFAMRFAVPSLNPPCDFVDGGSAGATTDTPLYTH